MVEFKSLDHKPLQGKVLHFVFKGKVPTKKTITLSVEVGLLANDMQTFHHLNLETFLALHFEGLLLSSFVNFPSCTLMVTTLKLGEALFSKPSSILQMSWNDLTRAHNYLTYNQ
jgi:hypothetical protein